MASSQFVFRYISQKDDNFDEEQTKINLSDKSFTLFKSKSFYKDDKGWGFKNQELGSGASGDVSSFISENDNEVVIKKILLDEKNTENDNNLDDFAHEAEMNKLVHGIGDLGNGSNSKFVYLRMKKLPPSLQKIYFDQ